MKGSNIIFGLIFIISVLYVYLISFHRVVTISDINSVINIIREPIVDNNRCKAYNETHFHCLPNVLFIGASKCGTTSMVEYLSQHPNVRFVNRRIHRKDHHKEVHRFDRNSFGYAIQSIDLMDEWASSPLVSDVNTTVIHYTPHYLYAPTVPYDVKAFYPYSSDLKFIVMLRDPVERALSSYWFQSSHLFNEGDTGSIDEFISLAMAEINERQIYERCMQSELSLPLSTSSQLMRHMYNFVHNKTKVSVNSNSKSQLYKAILHCFGKELRSPSLGHRHLDKGIYIDQIIRWLDNFQMDQFLFISLNDMQREPQKTFQQVLDFLNVISSAGSDINGNRDNGYRDSIINSIEFSKIRLKKPNALSEDVSSEFKKLLQDYFQPYNKQLLDLFGINI